MSSSYKKVEDLTPEDFVKVAVWEFTDSDSRDVVVRPVKELPIQSAGHRIIGTNVRLANGCFLWAMLGNLNLSNVVLNRHFLTVSIFSHDAWYHLARYHDVEYPARGASGLSEFLGLSIKEIFPIVYDVRACCIGAPDALVGAIEANVEPQLSREQIIQLALE